MLRIEYVYWLIGVLLLVATGFNLRERRWRVAAFWCVLSLPFLGGEFVIAMNAAGTRWPAQVIGVAVLALGVLAGRGTMLTRSTTAAALAVRRARARRLGNRLFVPALTIPLATLALVLVAPWLHWGGSALINPAQPTMVALGVACVIALAAALRTTRSPPLQALQEGRRLLDTLGCAALLPMILATLGSVFAATGVGDAIASLVGAVIPTDSRLACLLAFALGMVLFSMIMGNAFAAFPVLMAGIGLPLLVLHHGADAAVLGSIGMLTGYCGTLLTPMAANFNVVPAVLLELPDQYGVIRAQLPTALALLAVNVLLLWLLAFR